MKLHMLFISKDISLFFILFLFFFLLSICLMCYSNTLLLNLVVLFTCSSFINYWMERVWLKIRNMYNIYVLYIYMQIMVHFGFWWNVKRNDVFETFIVVNSISSYWLQSRECNTCGYEWVNVCVCVWKIEIKWIVYYEYSFESHVRMEFNICFPSQCTASISLWARDIFNLSFGVWFSPDSSANIFIFSLNDNFSGTPSPDFCCCCCCFSCNRRVRGSLQCEKKNIFLMRIVGFIYKTESPEKSNLPINFLCANYTGRLLYSIIPWFTFGCGWCLKHSWSFLYEPLQIFNI